VFSVATGVDVLLNVILLPGLGVVGASIAATASYIAAGLVFFHLFRGAERCSIRTALVPKWSDLQVLWRAFAEAQTALLRVLRRRLSPVAAPW
jgi:Na+-driven multidrug efflux pump